MATMGALRLWVPEENEAIRAVIKKTDRTTASSPDIGRFPGEKTALIWKSPQTPPPLK